jgi:hypothetical protein
MILIPRIHFHHIAAQGTLFGAGAAGCTVCFIQPTPDLQKHTAYQKHARRMIECPACI